MSTRRGERRIKVNNGCMELLDLRDRVLVEENEVRRLGIALVLRYL